MLLQIGRLTKSIFQSVTLEVNDTTAAKKDGPGMADYFETVIDRVEKTYGCAIYYFCMNSDGGAKKGRLILQQRRPWLLVLNALPTRSNNFI